MFGGDGRYCLAVQGAYFLPFNTVINSHMTTLYTIYQITNIVNNKIYVGAHQTTNVDDGYMGSSKILEAAIAKYGAENFIKEIIHMAKSHEDMYLYERTLVDKEFVGRDDTYNIRIGGKGGV